MLIVISYDIESNKKRRKITEILEGYGNRVQKSVFECDLDEKDKLDIYSQLNNVMQDDRMKNETDSIRFYKICERCLTQVEIIGSGKIELRESFVVF